MSSILSSLLLVFAFALGGLAPAIAGLLSAPPRADGPILVLHWPGFDVANTIERAGGHIVGLEQAPLGALAYSNDPSFLTALLSAPGVWIFDGEAIAKLCGVS